MQDFFIMISYKTCKIAVHIFQSAQWASLVSLLGQFWPPGLVFDPCSKGHLIISGCACILLILCEL